eukprot:4619079-Ditylum_brightwellii.AAC.1
MSLIAAVFSAETCDVILSSNKSGGRRLRMLTSLSTKALSSNKGIFLRHISNRRLQKWEPIWGRKVSLNKKSLVLLGTSLRKLAKLLAYIHAQSLFKPVVHRISSKFCNIVPSLTYFVLTLAVTRGTLQSLCCATLPSGDALLVAVDAA